MTNSFRMVFLGIALACASVAYAAKPGARGGATTSPGSHIVANPNDYYLQANLTLFTTEDVNGATRTYPAGTRWYQVPNVEQLRAELATGTYSGADRDAKARVVEGYDIMNKTYQKIGMARTDGKPPLFKGKLMNCSTCHAQAGTVPNAWPFTRTYSLFGDRASQTDPVHQGEVYAPLGYWRDTTTVNRDCGINCAGQGHIPLGSDEMLALNAWVRAVTDGIYAGEGILLPELKLKVNNTRIPGARNPIFSRVLGDATFKANVAAGKLSYARACASCHGKDGLGKWSDRDGYTVPPVAGPGSHTKAGGPYMAPVLAAFIQRQMPLSRPGSLSEQDALNIATYLTDLPRDRRWWEDYYYDHNPCGRPAYLPLDVGVIPRGFPFTAAQVKYGPWKPINDWLKSTGPYASGGSESGRGCAANNYTLDPKLPENFDYGFDDVTGTFTNPGVYSPPQAR